MVSEHLSQRNKLRKRCGNMHMMKLLHLKKEVNLVTGHPCSWLDEDVTPRDKHCPPQKDKHCWDIHVFEIPSVGRLIRAGSRMVEGRACNGDKMGSYCSMRRVTVLQEGSSKNEWWCWW